MHKDIHIKSLQVTLEENVKKIKSLQKLLLFITIVFLGILLGIVLFYHFSDLILFLTGVVSLYLVVKFIQLNRLKTTNQKIEQKLKKLK